MRSRGRNICQDFNTIVVLFNNHTKPTYYKETAAGYAHSLVVHNTNETYGLATYILDNLEAAPPVTLATRRFVSSVFNSSSCFSNSFLSFVRSSEHFTLPWKNTISTKPRLQATYYQLVRKA